MTFELSDTQREIKDLTARLLRDQYDFAARQKIATSQAGFSRDMWRTFAELGLLGIAFDDDHGGMGGGFADFAAVMEEAGRALVLEPLVPNLVLAGGLIAEAMPAEDADPLLAGIASGDLLVALGHSESGVRYELSHVETAARLEGNAYVLDGSKCAVFGGGLAGQFVISARTSGSTADPEGISLFLVDADAPGLARRGYQMVDDMGAAQIDLCGTPARLIGPLGAALPLIERAHDRAVAAVCAEAVGAMSAAFEITVDYLKTRRQFGTTIGSFQALQHKAVDMYVAIEHARSMAMLAARYADASDSVERARAVSAAKIGVDKAARLVGQLAIQMHGGIGLTEEYAVGHYFRRLTAIGLSFGDIHHHCDRLADLAPAALEAA